jgi:pimeloyl-ACP methyl ester carboxylesterase
VSTGAHALPHRIHRANRWLVWLFLALVSAAAMAVGLDRAFFPHEPLYSWPPKPCVVKGVPARCGTFEVPENRAEPNGRRLALRVVVLPASLEATPRIAFAYLAGGPGDAATEVALAGRWQSSQLNASRDFLLVDQRGTDGSRSHGGDVTQYGTRMAMDDLDAVRAALGYRQLDVYGGSYGATAAQVYSRLHPSRVHTLILSGASALDVSFFGRYAVNAQRALDQLAQSCAADAGCRKAFPDWEREFGALVSAWNDHPIQGMSGEQLASVVHKMLRDVNTAVSIPLVVSHAANGDYAPLEHAGSGDLDIGHLSLMGASIWCNEPWVGLDAEGPWGTDFDSYTTALIAEFRTECGSVPKRTERRTLWTLPVSSRVPVVALVGGADPQDPLTNLSDFKRHFPDSRIIVLPHMGHDFGWDGACDGMLADFVNRGTTKGLDATSCVGEVVVPPFRLTE